MANWMNEINWDENYVDGHERSHEAYVGGNEKFNSCESSHDWRTRIDKSQVQPEETEHVVLNDAWLYKGISLLC